MSFGCWAIDLARRFCPFKVYPLFLSFGFIPPMGVPNIRLKPRIFTCQVFSPIRGILRYDMGNETTFERVKRVTAEELGVNDETVVESASFTEDLGADSLDVVELVMAFEDEFEITIPDEDATKETLGTVGMAVAYIDKKVG